MFSRKANSRLSAVAGLVALYVLALPDLAAAEFQWEFYTYGGFPEVVSAFNKLALIQSSAGIKILAASLWTGMLVMSLILVHYGRITQIGREDGEMTGFKGSTPSVIISMILGAGIYGGLVVPTSTLHIYDKTENQYQAVGGIPVIVTVAAGLTNAIERAIVDLSETAGDPLSFSKQGGIKGIMVMNSIMLRGGEPPDGDAGFAQTLDNYTMDCVSFELARTGSTLTVDELKNKTDSVVTSFAKATNPANFTVVHDAANPGGGAYSCTDAWTNISGRANAATAGNLFKSVKRRACKDAGYSVYQADAAKGDLALLECVTNTDALIKTIDGAWSLDKFIMESVFINRFWAVMVKEDPALHSARATAVRSASGLQEFMGSLASKRGYMVAMGAASLPFVLLFMATRMWPIASKLALGFFLLPAVWGILMAIASDFFLTSAVTNWRELFAAGGWGVSSYDVLTSDTAKQMNWWGVYLAATFGLAMTITNKIGGLAAVVGGGAAAQGAMAEGDMARGRIGAGAQARMDVATAEGMAKTASGWASGYALAHAMPNQGKLLNYEMASQAGTFGGQQQLLNDLGAGGLANAKAGAAINETLTAGAGGEAQRKQGVKTSLDRMTYEKEAALSVTGLDSQSTGGSADTKAKWDAAAMIAQRKAHQTPEYYQSAQETLARMRLGDMEGTMNAYKGAQKAGFAGGIEDFVALQSEVKATQGFQQSDVFKDYAKKNGVDMNDLARQFAHIKTAEDGGRASAYSGGIGKQAMGVEKAEALLTDLKGMDQFLSAEQAKPKYAELGQKYGLGAEAVQDLDNGRRHMASGNTEPAAADKTFITGASKEQIDTATVGAYRAGATAKTETEAKVGTADGQVEVAKLNNRSVEAQAKRQTITDGLAKDAAASAYDMFAKQVYGSSDPEALKKVHDAKARGGMSTSLTEDMAKYMNEQAKQSGSKATFKEGQQVSFSMGEDGSIKYADGKGGMFALTKDGWTKETKENTSHDGSTKSESGSSIIAYNRVTYDSAPQMTIGGQVFQAGGQLEIKGNNFTYLAKPVGSDEMRSVAGVVQRDASGQIKGYSSVVSDGKGGVGFSANVVADELRGGKTAQLGLALKGDDSAKSAYVAALGEELGRTMASSASSDAKAKQSIFTQVSAKLGISTPVGGAEATAGARLATEYSQGRATNVKAFETASLGIINSGVQRGRSEEQIAAELRTTYQGYVQKGVDTMRRGQGDVVQPPVLK